MEELELIKQIAGQSTVVLLLCLILYWAKKKLDAKEEEIKVLHDKLNDVQVDTLSALSELNKTLDKLEQNSIDGIVQTKETVSHSFTSLKELITMKIDMLIEKMKN